MGPVGLSATSFAEEGFLQHCRGREFMVQGHGPDNSSGLLMFKAVVERGTTGELVALGSKQGLSLHATNDDDYPELVMLEAVGLLALVEHLAKDLVARGYHRLPEPL